MLRNCEKFQLDLLGKEIDMRINAAIDTFGAKNLWKYMYEGWCGP